VELGVEGTVQSNHCDAKGRWVWLIATKAIPKNGWCQDRLLESVGST
jgi:hypothetical protein